jgi:cytosine/uracil/thiamine/allantoin permease
VNPAHLAPVFLQIYSFAWFSGFAIAFVAYLLFRKIAPNA